jgi:hypothetical protein
VRRSWGCVSTINSRGQTIFVADAHRDNGNRLVVHSDEKLTAFLELEKVTRESLRSQMPNEARKTLLHEIGGAEASPAPEALLTKSLIDARTPKVRAETGAVMNLALLLVRVKTAAEGLRAF